LHIVFFILDFDVWSLVFSSVISVPSVANISVDKKWTGFILDLSDLELSALG